MPSRGVSPHRSLLVLIAAGVCAWGGLVRPAPLAAELPSIRLHRLQPLGAAAGSSVEVEIQGADLEGLDRLLFDHPGISAQPVPDKERRFLVSVAPDVPPGTYDVYLSGRFGVSNPRLFMVTQGLGDVADQGQNHSPEAAQPLAIDSAINGVADGNAVDFYRVPLVAGQRVLIDCHAQRLDSELDGVLALTTLDGRPLASSGDYFGQDPFLDFVAPVDGDYVIALHDLSYRGGAPYRLVVTARPQVELVFPAAVQVGQTATLTALGRNLASVGGRPSAWRLGDWPLEELTFPIQFSPELLERGEFRFRDHPRHHSTAPTAATCTLVGAQVEVPGVNAAGSHPPVLATSDKVVLESEPNDNQDAPQPLTLPLVVAGRFDHPRDADWYEFTPPEKGMYAFNVYCERIAGRADPYLVIADERGGRIHEIDDYGHRVNAFDGHLRDPSQEVSLEADRKYRVLVQDRYGRGGARYHYLLEIRPAEADFFPAVIHRSNPEPRGLTLFRGTADWLDVVVHHRGNARTDVTITAEQLPPGVHMTPTTIVNDIRGTVVFWADADAPVFTGPIRLWATAEHEGRTIRREVRPYSRVRGNVGSSPQRELMLAVREEGPFELRIEPPEIEVAAGATADLTLHLVRHWPQGIGTVSIQPLAFPGTFHLGNFDMAAEVASSPLRITVQSNARPGRYTLSVLGQAQVPFHKDPASSERPQTLVSIPSRPVTISVVPPRP